MPMHILRGYAIRVVDRNVLKSHTTKLPILLICWCRMLRILHGLNLHVLCTIFFRCFGSTRKSWCEKILSSIIQILIISLSLASFALDYNDLRLYHSVPMMTRFQTAVFIIFCISLWNNQFEIVPTSNATFFGTSGMEHIVCLYSSTFISIIALNSLARKQKRIWKWNEKRMLNLFLWNFSFSSNPLKADETQLLLTVYLVFKMLWISWGKKKQQLIAV